MVYRKLSLTLDGGSPPIAANHSTTISSHPCGLDIGFGTNTCTRLPKWRVAWPRRLRRKTILGFKIASVLDLFLASELALILEFCGNGTLTRMRRAQGLNGMWIVDVCVCVVGLFCQGPIAIRASPGGCWLKSM